MQLYVDLATIEWRMDTRCFIEVNTKCTRPLIIKDCVIDYYRSPVQTKKNKTVLGADGPLN